MVFWIFVICIVFAALLFGYIVDNKSDRYKRMSDSKVKSDIEDIKDQTHKEGYPTNNNWHGPL